MPTVRLTAGTVESARPPASGRLELFDEDLPGFCIRVTPNGRRTACVFYRVGSRLRRATLGTLPPLTLADARQLAREAKKLWETLDANRRRRPRPVLEKGKKAPRLGRDVLGVRGQTRRFPREQPRALD